MVGNAGSDDPAAHDDYICRCGAQVAPVLMFVELPLNLKIPLPPLL
jgi:hypothetical protein